MNRIARLALPPVPTSAADARRFVGSTLVGWGSDDVADAARLLVSELVTNAVLHARTDVEVVVKLRRKGVRVEVRDGSPATPTVRHYDDEAMTGRGIALVDQLANRWGVDTRNSGKTVWFELA